MNFIYRLFCKALLLTMYIPRNFYYWSLKKRLKNNKPTIIASDCFGGIIQHNLGLQFRSPTINLFFSKADFITFLMYLKGYLSAELVEITDASVEYPIGELEYNNNRIHINFMHYTSFAEAKEKWNERKQRIDYSNIYIIQIIPSATTEDITLFNNLPYKNKMLITSENPLNSENVIVHSVLKKENYRPGEILEYKSMFAVRRYMDEIDYVSFLNRPN